MSAASGGLALPRAGQLDVESDGLVEARRERARTRLAGRDTLATLAGAGLFLAAAVPIALLGSSGRAPSPLLVALFIAAYALSSRVEFEVGIGSAIPTQLVFVPMLFVLPLTLVPLCVALGLLLGDAPQIVRGRLHGERSLLNLVGSWHALGPVLVLAVAAEPAPGWDRWPLLVGALAAQFAADFGGSSLRALLAFDVRPGAQLRLMGPVWLVDLALAPLGLLVAIAAFTEPYSFTLALPLLGLLAVLSRERSRRIDHALELGQAYRGTAFLLGDVVEADDAYTGSHSRDVVDLVLAVSDVIGLDARARRHAEFTALLHDVGKIRIPGEIINKPAALTHEERAVIELHTVEGERMLEQVGGLLGEVGRLVRSCHEHWDGGGYPDGLAGEEIPLVARVVCTCDAFSAMTTDRPYRRGCSTAEALAELRRCAGTQFDPGVVEAIAVAVARS